MDSNLLVEVFLGLTALSFFLYRLLRARQASKPVKTREEAPEPEGAWPVIGHLLLLRGKIRKENLAFILGALADKHGPAFTIQLGVHRTLVVSSLELAKECLVTHDKALADRPTTAAGKHLGYGYSMVAFSPYGPYWRQIRKLTAHELLSNSRLESLRHVRANEVDNHMKELYGRCMNTNHGLLPVKVEMKRWLRGLTCNIIAKMVAGENCFGSTGGGNSSDDRDGGRGLLFLEPMSRLFDLIGVFVLSDVLPFLKWLDLGGNERAMKRTARDLDLIFETWLDEHRRRRVAGNSKGDQDFMDMMLSFFESAGELHAHDSEKTIKANSLALTIGGTETTALSITWVLTALLNNPQVLRKAQEELDVHVGKDRAVDDSDIKNLVYLQAIVKETFRLYPTSPLLVPHKAMEDCEIGGFHVASGTLVIVNALKIQRDPRVWPEPLRFVPERFTTSHADVDLRGQHFELLPFGSGRRSCPGASFALQGMHLVLACLIQGFELRAPSDEPVDMTAGVGFIFSKVMPLEVICTPRLSRDLYK